MQIEIHRFNDDRFLSYYTFYNVLRNKDNKSTAIGLKDVEAKAI